MVCEEFHLIKGRGVRSSLERKRGVGLLGFRSFRLRLSCVWMCMRYKEGESELKKMVVRTPTLGQRETRRPGEDMGVLGDPQTRPSHIYTFIHRYTSTRLFTNRFILGV